MTTEETYKTYPHNPPHLFRRGGKYFITGATYEHRRYMRTSASKDSFVHYLSISFNHFNWEIEDWVVLDNHYHLMVNAPENVNTLSEMMNNLHRFSAIAIRKILKSDLECIECANRVGTALTQSVHSRGKNCVGTTLTQSVYSRDSKDYQKKIFHNYWDTCINYEKSWYARLHYIWFNPVKHGYVNHPWEWKWGSFYKRWQEDRERMLEIMSDYPCDRVNVYDDF